MACCRALLTLTGWLLLTAVLRAEIYEQRQGDAVVRLKPGSVEAGRVKVRLADEIVLTVTVEGEYPLRVEGGDDAVLRDQLRTFRGGGWNHWEGTATRTRTDEREEWQQTYRLDPGKDGEVELRLVPFAYTTGPEGKPRRVAWEPILVAITTEVARPDLSELRDITGPEELPPVRRWWLPWLLGLGALLLSAGLILGGRELKRRWAAPAPPLAPHEWALRELERVEALGLPVAGQIERHHTLLCDTLRRYFELRFDLKATKQTTVEFLETVRSLPELSSSQQDRLREFLERCDLAKFARAEPAVEECRATGTLARQLVEETASVGLPLTGTPKSPV